MAKFIAFILFIFLCSCTVLKLQKKGKIRLYAPIATGSYTCENLLQDENNNYYINGTLRKSKGAEITGWWAYTLAVDSLLVPKWFSVDSLQTNFKTFSSSSTISNQTLFSCVSDINNNNWLISRDFDGDNKNFKNLNSKKIKQLVTINNKPIFVGSQNQYPAWGEINSSLTINAEFSPKINGSLFSVCKSKRNGFYFVGFSKNSYELFVIKTDDELKYKWHRIIKKIPFEPKKLFIQQTKNNNVKVIVPEKKNNITFIFDLSETCRDVKFSKIDEYIADMKADLIKTKKGFYKLSQSNKLSFIEKIWGVGSDSGVNSFIYKNNNLTYIRPIAEQWNMYIGLMQNASYKPEIMYFKSQKKDKK